MRLSSPAEETPLVEPNGTAACTGPQLRGMTTAATLLHRQQVRDRTVHPPSPSQLVILAVHLHGLAASLTAVQWQQRLAF
jgi:hypothetical protein